MQISSISDWSFNADRPLLISGPCSAESETQVMQTAEQLKDAGVHLFRAGIWKPRTRPGAFEGIGAIGLKWLQKVRDEFDMPFTVEVANKDHVQIALDHGVDAIWIGARTTVNPFTVQEIAEAMEGADIPVLVKNPVNPDIDLWRGAIERFHTVGINKLAAIFRGFSTYNEKRYRNQPNWEIPIELMRLMPGLPVICDPSHISGRRENLLELSQKALDMNFDGLMIESHIDPDHALSDKEQQLKPDDLISLLASLIHKRPEINNISLLTSLEKLRTTIDQLDEDILSIIAQRMEVVKEIGEYKKDNNITILQPERWNEIVTTRTKSATSKGLSDDLILKIWQIIHQESIRKQTAAASARATSKSDQE